MLVVTPTIHALTHNNGGTFKKLGKFAPANTAKNALVAKGPNAVKHNGSPNPL
jgi:hypothetical protein